MKHAIVVQAKFSKKHMFAPYCGSAMDAPEGTPVEPFLAVIRQADTRYSSIERTIRMLPDVPPTYHWVKK